MVFEFTILMLELISAFTLVGITFVCFLKEMKFQNELDAVGFRLKKNSGI